MRRRLQLVQTRILLLHFPRPIEAFVYEITSDRVHGSFRAGRL